MINKMKIILIKKSIKAKIKISLITSMQSMKNKIRKI